MNISQDAIQKIIGIEEKVKLDPIEMADKLNITFYPFDPAKVSSNVKSFSDDLKNVFDKYKVNIIPYEKSLVKTPYKKIISRSFKIIINDLLFFIGKHIGYLSNRDYIPFGIFNYIKKRKKIKRGISVIMIGEGEIGNLPIDHTSSFTESSVITIIDFPKNIDSDTEFHEHFDTALSLFAKYMTNIIIGVDDKKWILYNFNASHPIYSRKEKFEDNVIHALIPKIAAPLRPHKFKDFYLVEKSFDPKKEPYITVIDDMVSSGSLLEDTNLYPPGKKISDLPFQNKFYQWIGKIHLDKRSGMSYGFLARQLPTKLSELIKISDAYKLFPDKISKEKDYFTYNNEVYLIIHLSKGDYCVKIPSVSVLTQRSGANKTHINPNTDLIIMGLENGNMFLQTPEGLKLNNDYKPSFDTKVILAHAVGNAIIGSIIKKFDPNHPFVHLLEERGPALAHWHGYINPNYIPHGWHVYGHNNPHVACSTAQAAIYALDGKLSTFIKTFNQGDDYQGDIHIEPHHGSNIVYPSLKSLAEFFIKNPGIAKLGNEHLKNYYD